MNWTDPDRIAAALAAAFGSSIMGLLAFTAVVFAVPPPTRRQLWRAVVEVVLGLYAAIGAGYMAGAPLAAFINGLGAKVVPGFSAVDPLVGGLFVGAVVLRGLPGAVDLVLNLLKRRAAQEGGAKA